MTPPISSTSSCAQPSPDCVGAIRSPARSSCLSRGAVAVGAAVALRAAAIFAAVFAFDESSFVFGETAVLGMDCEPRSSAGMAFSPATVNFNEYAWPVSSSRRQASIPVFALISRTRLALRSLVDLA